MYIIRAKLYNKTSYDWFYIHRDMYKNLSSHISDHSASVFSDYLLAEKVMTEAKNKFTFLDCFEILEV